MNIAEDKFYEEFHKSAKLVAQPRMCKNKKLIYRPDFLDLRTNTYYEIIGTATSYNYHKRRKHFEFMRNEGHKLIVAVYLEDTKSFFLFKDLSCEKINYSLLYMFLQCGKYKVTYGELTNICSTALFKEIEERSSEMQANTQPKVKYIQAKLTEEDFIVTKKAALDANIALQEYIRQAIFEKICHDTGVINKGLDVCFKNTYKAISTDEIGSSV